ncbi:MAG: helix-turn-helix transcriptional regulator [Clostridiaceae bacterium]|nr:helix-turn-helix transcriptional regulator [Clostridiaceae bacterium]
MEPINVEKFGQFIAALRREKGLTQKGLGERLFVSDKTVSKWERGLSMPSVELLLPLAETLGVTVTELLKGERMQAEMLPVAEVEQLVAQSLELSAGEREQRRKERNRWVKRYIVCILAAVGELFGLAVLGCDYEQMSYSVFLVTVLMLIFGGWFCLGAPETLPAYYDKYPVNYVTDGIFRMHVSGMRFNNSNWPHIVRACRRYTLTAAVGYPLLYGLLETTGFNQTFLPQPVLILAVCLGLFFPVVVVGKKYE